MCVTITPRAAKYMRQMVRFGEGSAAAGFRLAVKPGGCSGYDASFAVAEIPGPGDTVIEQNGALLFLTNDSCSLLQGHVIDYKESPASAGLTFTPPDGAKVCGCGSGSGSGNGLGPGQNVVTFMGRGPAPHCSKPKD